MFFSQDVSIKIMLILEKCEVVMKVAFLDRDGTINLDYPDMDWKNVENPILLDGAITGMKLLNNQGFEIIIVSNQYIIGEGVITFEQFNSFHNQLLEVLAINNIRVLDSFICPHSRTDNCECCKPKTGLILQAIEKYPHIDLSESIMCGDSVSDLKCAKTMGLKFYGIDFGENAIKDLSCLPTLVR
jgi:histidinol-phosphate phosphatase family domain/HAD-superfamily hydrolase, subfamily IIIA